MSTLVWLFVLSYLFVLSNAQNNPPAGAQQRIGNMYQNLGGMPGIQQQQVVDGGGMEMLKNVQGM